MLHNVFFFSLPLVVLSEAGLLQYVDELSYSAIKKSLEYFCAMNFAVRIQTLFISIFISEIHFLCINPVILFMFVRITEVIGPRLCEGTLDSAVVSQCPDHCIISNPCTALDQRLGAHALEVKESHLFKSME